MSRLFQTYLTHLRHHPCLAQNQIPDQRLGKQPPMLKISPCDLGMPEAAGLGADYVGEMLGEFAAEQVAESLAAGAVFGGPIGVAAAGFAIGFTLSLPTHLVANAVCGE